MLYKREGYPEENEIVLCTVTNVRYNSVFCKLDEYGRSGMIHISEVSPGRIRNIRDYVQEGKKVICKVLGIDKEKGHIDLSLRRVTETQKRAKNSVIKQEQKAEKIVELSAEEIERDFKKLYDEVASKILKEYRYLHVPFQEVVDEDKSLSEFDLDDEVVEVLEENIRRKIKPKKVSIGGEFKLEIYSGDGLSVMKDIFKPIEDNGKADIKYAGGGSYDISVEAENYKKAEKILDKIVSGVKERVDKEKGAVSFQRAKAKG